MNAIGGVCRLDGGPVGHAVVRRMAAAAQLLLPHRRTSWAGGPLAFTCAAVRFDGGVEGAVLVRDRPGRRALVFDGRLDNRKDLIAQLGRQGASGDSGDAELVLAAHDAWGDACAAQLVGDFAFGLWDRVRRRLLCVRDALGVRPLYVLLHGGRLCFATQLRQVLAAHGRVPPFDPEFVADRLALGVDRADADCTPYRGVSRLKPGHRLIAADGRVRVERYWQWRTPNGGGGGNDEESIDRFRETFFEAVACRMRGGGPVWADVSGGLDSSSIAAVAVRRGGSAGVRAVSVVFGQSTLSDERPWAETAARELGIEQRFIDGDVHHPFSRLREAADYWEEPHAAAAFFGVHRAYGRLFAGPAPPVLLAGVGAEAIVMHKHQAPVHLADLLRRGRISALWSVLHRWQRVSGAPLSNLAWSYCLRPLVRRRLVEHEWSPGTHDWVEPAFARRWDLRGRTRNAHMPPVEGGPADRRQVEMIGRISGFLVRGYLEKACDIRYPFLHRPLVELALAVPWRVKEVPGETKALLRRAMRGVLPEEIRRRTIDVSTGHAVYAGLRREWPVLREVADASVLVDLGIVNRKRLHDALHLARQGHAVHLGGLLTTLTLDAWLQARKGGAAWLCAAA